MTLHKRFKGVAGLLEGLWAILQCEIVYRCASWDLVRIWRGMVSAWDLVGVVSVLSGQGSASIWYNVDLVTGTQSILSGGDLVTV